MASASSCLHFSSIGVAGMHCHAWIAFILFILALQFFETENSRHLLALTLIM